MAAPSPAFWIAWSARVDSPRAQPRRPARGADLAHRRGRDLEKPLTDIIEEINAMALVGLDESAQQQLIQSLETVAENLKA